jgi:hypothetical protein
MGMPAASRSSHGAVAEWQAVGHQCRVGAAVLLSTYRSVYATACLMANAIQGGLHQGVIVCGQAGVSRE